tara:strand:- start:4025 stop:4294 length:270 start_codon:yes stop_codon:yes gene_type:complete
MKKIRPLPSNVHSQLLIEGKPGGLTGVLSDIVLRSFFIGLGLYTAGTKEEIVKKSLYASTAIEIGVLLWQFQGKKNEHFNRDRKSTVKL